LPGLRVLEQPKREFQARERQEPQRGPVLLEPRSQALPELALSQALELKALLEPQTNRKLLLQEPAQPELRAHRSKPGLGCLERSEPQPKERAMQVKQAQGPHQVRGLREQQEQWEPQVRHLQRVLREPRHPQSWRG
jgi:hypothetical protein